MTIRDDVKQYGETAAEQGKQALSEARKSLYAVVGASDLVLAQATEKSKVLPRKAEAVFLGVRGKAEELPAQAKSTFLGVRGKAEELPAQAKSTLSETTSQALSTYTELAERGAKVVDELRKDPRVQRVIRTAERGVDKVEGNVEGLLDAAGYDVTAAKDKVEDKVAEVPAKATAARTTAVKATTARATAAKTAAANKVTAAKEA